VGLKPYHPSRWLLDHPFEEALALIRWSDEELGGRAFVDWYPFEHPQLGPVELGGWDMVNYWYNPPFDRIESEVAPHTEWVIYQALAAPQLKIRSLTAEPVGDGVHNVRAVVANAGWLPTYVTHRARDRKLVAPVTATLELPAAATVVGRSTLDLGQLEGRSEARTTTTWWGHNPGTPDLTTAEWVVTAPAGTAVTVRASHDRAGTVRATVELG
jgi:murein tripeptide amidase MpaA